MADPTTTNYGFTTPTVGADPDTWGTLLNTNWSNLDTYLLSAAFGAHGQCRLNYVSATQIALNQANGSGLIINNVLQSVPAAGVTLANTGLTASTLYYIYAKMVSGSMTLAASTTAYTVQSNGVATLTGDVTQTLVGMVYMNASSQFVDSATSRTVASYFNRKTRALTTSQTNSSFTATSLTACGPTLTLLSWADEACTAYMSISGQPNNTNNLECNFSIDGTNNIAFNSTQGSAASTGTWCAQSCGNAFALSEGKHALIPLAEWSGAPTGSSPVNLAVFYATTRI